PASIPARAEPGAFPLCAMIAAENKLLAANMDMNMSILIHTILSSRSGISEIIQDVLEVPKRRKEPLPIHIRNGTRPTDQTNTATCKNQEHPGEAHLNEEVCWQFCKKRRCLS